MTLVLNTRVISQIVPNYDDRLGIINLDSLQFSKQTQSQFSTDGFIEQDEYFIGPGDQLSIQISGVELFNYVVQVDPEGFVNIPKIGLISLKGLNLTDSKKIIKEKILLSFKNVEIFISLTKFRNIKVTIVGEVRNSTTFTLTSNTRLFDAVSRAGLKNSADIRNINITNDNKINRYDLLQFIRLSETSNNPYLREGDIIRINKSDKMVSIFGAVLYPGNYEFVKGEKVLELIKTAGGYLHNAKLDSIEVISYDDDNETLISKYYKETDILNIEINKFDKIVVREKTDYYTDRMIRIDGFVKYPGYHKIVKDKTKLSELILKSAGGFRDKASLKDAYVLRTLGSEEKDSEFERLKIIPISEMTEDEYDYFKAKSREEKGKIVLDFRKLFVENDSKEDLIMKRGDIVVVPESKDYITLVGQIVRPGNIIFKENLSVEDYIDLAGGFSWRAIENDVRVIKSESGEWIEADEVESLSPGDIIWIPEDPPAPPFWETFKDVLTITGQLATVITAIIAIIVASR